MRIPAFDPEKRLWSEHDNFYNSLHTGLFTVREDGSASIHAYRAHNKPDRRKYYETFNVTICSSRETISARYTLTDPDGTKLKRTWLQNENQILVVDLHQKRAVRGDGTSYKRPDHGFLTDVKASTSEVYAASPDAPLLGFEIAVFSPRPTPPEDRKRAMEFIQACKTWAHLTPDVRKDSDGKLVCLTEPARVVVPSGARTVEQTRAVYNFTAETFEIYPDIAFNDLTPLERLTIARKGKATYPHRTTTLPYALIT